MPGHRSKYPWLGRDEFLLAVPTNKWKAKYDGMNASALKCLKELEAEAQTLKDLYAELGLKYEVRKDIVEKSRQCKGASRACHRNCTFR